MKSWKLAFWIILGLAAMMAYVNGCANHPVPSNLPAGHKVPQSLQGTNTTLDWLIFLSIVLTGGGAGLFFFVPAFHRISGIMLAAGGGVLTVSLILKTTLWLIPWIAGTLLIGGFVFLAYELWLKIKERRNGIASTPH